MIDVRPDPAHPRGGYAQLTFDASQVSGDSVSVEVFDLYQELYLGKAGWQPERFSFGPYPVDRSSGQGQVVLGPEVVDKLEEFSVLRLGVGALTAELSWPEEIVHSPKLARSDTAIKTGSVDAEPTTAAPIKMKTPDADELGTPAAEPQVDKPKPLTEAVPEQVVADPEEPEVYDEEPTDPEKSSKLPVILGALIVLAAIAAAAFYFLSTPEPEPEPLPPVPDPPPIPAPPQPTPPPAPDLCSDSELANAARLSFSDLRTALRGCGGQVSPDTALGLVEGAVAEGDPEALAFFGTLYDEAQADPVIKDQIGLTLGDDPAKAAEYYSRAIEAGSTTAPELLTGVCNTLLLRADTLSISAREDYCPN